MKKNGHTKCITHVKPQGSQPYWAYWSYDELLDLRLCDLEIKIEKSPLENRIARLYRDLGRKGFTNFKPHCWLSTEWFSPDGIPGIGLPFYLAHPKLAKLEKKQMLYVEGNSEQECMKILRHEAGHCICTAYRLHYKKQWRKLFGSFATPYPDTYKPRPNSRKYVLHLDYWYAQSHPAEDFAETFAVWLKPKSAWRQRYQDWPALRKLTYVNELMQELAGTPTKVRSKRHVEGLKENKKTLREYYKEKRLRYADEWPDFFDMDLSKLFSNDPKFAKKKTAASFLRDYSPELRSIVAQWTGTHPYTIDQVLRDMIDRCKELKLRLRFGEAHSRSQANIMLTVQVMNYIHSGHYRVPL